MYSQKFEVYWQTVGSFKKVRTDSLLKVPKGDLLGRAQDPGIQESRLLQAEPCLFFFLVGECQEKDQETAARSEPDRPDRPAGKALPAGSRRLVQFRQKILDKFSTMKSAFETYASEHGPHGVTKELSKKDNWNSACSPGPGKGRRSALDWTLRCSPASLRPWRGHPQSS
eukprot:g3688.t1